MDTLISDSNSFKCGLLTFILIFNLLSFSIAEYFKIFYSRRIKYDSRTKIDSGILYYKQARLIKFSRFIKILTTGKVV